MAAARPGPRRLDDDLDLVLDVELEEELAAARSVAPPVDEEPELDEPITEEVPLPSAAAAPARFAVRTEVVTVLDLVGAVPLPAFATLLGALVDGLREADAALRADGDAPATVVASVGKRLFLRTPAAIEEVGLVVARHGRLAARAIGEALPARVETRGATAWGDVAEGDGVLLGAAMGEAMSWSEDDRGLGVRLAPSARLACGDVVPDGWAAVDGRVGLVWIDDVRAAERVLAGLGPYTPETSTRLYRALAFLRTALKAPEAAAP